MGGQTDQSIDRRCFRGVGVSGLVLLKWAVLTAEFDGEPFFFFLYFLVQLLFFPIPVTKIRQEWLCGRNEPGVFEMPYLLEKKILLIFNVSFGFSSSCERITFLLHFQVTNIWKTDLLWSCILEKKKESKNGTDLFCVRDACIFLFFICLHHPMNPLRCKNVVLQRACVLFLSRQCCYGVCADYCARSQCKAQSSNRPCFVCAEVGVPFTQSGGAQMSSFSCT